MDKSSLWILLFKILIINNIYREIDQKNLILSAKYGYLDIIFINQSKFIILFSIMIEY